VLMTVGVMALAVPLSSNFAGEFLILAGVFQQYWLWAAIGAGAIVLAAMYMLRLISAVLHREPGPAVSEAALDLRRGELAIVVPLVAALLALSAWPAGVSARVFPATGAAVYALSYGPMAGGLYPGVPVSCDRAVAAFGSRQFSSGILRAQLPVPSTSSGPAGGVITFKALEGRVACLDGGHVDIALPPLRLPLPRLPRTPGVLGQGSATVSSAPNLLLSTTPERLGYVPPEVGS